MEDPDCCTLRGPAPGESLMPTQTHINALSDVLIEKAFAFVCALDAPPCGGGGYRPCPALPLVCKRWNRVYVQSPVLWERLSLDWGLLMKRYILAAPPDCHIPRFGSVVSWLQSRAPWMAHLDFNGCHVLGQTLEHMLHHLGTLWLLGGRLQHVSLSDVVGRADGAVHQLARCTTLRSLSLHCQEQGAGRLQPLAVSVSALQQLSALTALSSLDLSVDRIEGSTRDLQAALAGLSCLTVRCREEAAILHPELLSVVTSLRRLELQNVRLAQFTVPLAASLSCLSHLRCRDVMAAQPRKGGSTLWEALRHLAGLRELSLEDQSNAHVGLPANALACTGLQGLTVLRSCMGSWPGPAALSVDPSCLPRLRSLQLGFLTMHLPPPTLVWHQLTSLTRLSWQEIRVGEPREHRELLPKPPIMAVPSEISRLRQLQQLSIEYCELAEVPACVQALPCLTQLSLEGNRISQLPEGPWLAGIRHLNLAANDLQSLPCGVLAAHSLELLSLARNPSLVLPGNTTVLVLSSLPKLQRLCLTEANGMRLGVRQPGALPASVQVLEELQASWPCVVWGEGPPGLW